jgi:hypothetical protein
MTIATDVLEFYIYGRALIFLSGNFNGSSLAFVVMTALLCTPIFVKFIQQRPNIKISTYVLPTFALALEVTGRYQLLMAVLCLKFYIGWVADGLAYMAHD